MIYPLSYGCQWAELNFCPHKLSNLRFTRLPSLHVDFYSRHVDNSVLFFLHNYPLLIPLHNTSVLIKICRFLINVAKFNANPYEIGPSNASQGQHGIKDATKQMKNLTLARTRTQVLGISSADDLPTKLRVPVGGTEFLSL